MRNVLAALTVALGVSGCSGSSGNVGVAGVPCTALALFEPLVYPANGGTGVPDTVSLVIVGNFIRGTVYLVPNAGPSISSSTTVAVPSPLPTPNSAIEPITPEFAGSLSAFKLPPLAAATTYTVTSQAPGTNTCPNEQSGSFTTQ